MKRILYFFLILFILIAACQEQPPVSDNTSTELKSELTFHKLSREVTGDTGRVKQLIEIGINIQKKFPDSSLQLYRKALAISNKMHYPQGIATVLMNIGNYYYNYTQQPNYAKARVFFQKAVLYSQLPEVTNKKLLPGAHIAVGNTFYQEGQYDSANYAYFRALAILQSGNPVDTMQLIFTYMDIGAAFEYLDKDYTRCMQYSQKAKKLAAQAKDTLLLIHTNRNIAVIYQRQNKPDSSLTTSIYALRLAQQLNAKSDIHTIYNDIGTGYMAMGEFIKGKAYLDSAADIDKKLTASDIGLLQNQGYVYFHLGQFAKAVPYYKKALSLSIKRGEKGYGLLTSYNMLTRLYDTLGQWQQATHYSKAYIFLKDSLINEEKIHSVNQLEIKYKSIEKDRLLASKNLELVKAQGEIQRKTATTWIAILCTLLLTSVLVLLRYHQSNKLRKLQQGKELELLKASIAGEATERVRVGRELHDGIGGLLSAIKLNLVALRLKRADIADEQNFITTIALADQAATGLRETAHNLVPPGLLKNGLFKTIQEFCLRVGTPAATRLEVTETGLPQRLDATHELVIYRIVQELIHNILKHAGATEGQISLSWQEQVLLITVEDNGAGSRSRSSDGIGLENIRKGIERLNGTMDMESIAGEGTSVYLEFPI